MEKVVLAGVVEAGSMDLLRWAVVQLVVSKLFIYLPLLTIAFINNIIVFNDLQTLSIKYSIQQCPCYSST